jgi:hypothetical protein
LNDDNERHAIGFDVSDHRPSPYKAGSDDRADHRREIFGSSLMV